MYKLPNVCNYHQIQLEATKKQNQEARYVAVLKIARLAAVQTKAAYAQEGAVTQRQASWSYQDGREGGVPNRRAFGWRRME